MQAADNTVGATGGGARGELPGGAAVGTSGRRGFILILSSPSGAGKTTLTRMLLTRPELDLTLSISVTTRARRHSEADGVHYSFISRRRFLQLRDDDELLEWAEVHGNFYGTPREPVERVLATGRDILFDIDWQGTQQVKAKTGMDAVTVFILPPSMEELRARLERRAEDPADVIARRLANARNEIARWAQYDYVLVNDDIQETFGSLKAIIACERCKAQRATATIGRFVDGLLAERSVPTP